MLYDPKWEQKTELEPISLAALVAWLETQPADVVYPWLNTNDCLACRYLRAIRGPQGEKTARYRDVFGGCDNYHAIAAATPWTYGAALKRARSMMTAQVEPATSNLS